MSNTPTIPKGLPFDAAPGGKFPQIQAAPYRIIYNSSATPTDGVKTGNIYKVFADVVTVANLFQGPVEIYIAGGSVVPAGNYNMPVTWYLSTDSGGASFPTGVYFSTAPIAIIPDCAATLAFHESAGGSTFTQANPMTTISTCVITLGTNGTLINGTNGGGLFLRACDVASSGGQTLMTGSANTVTALDVTTIPSNMLPASMTLQYDSTSHVNSQNGNTGTALFSSMTGATGPAGPSGATGPQGPPGTGGASYLPPTEPADSNVYVLSVDGSGNTAWQPQGGYQISFTTSQAAVEIGTQLTTIPWSFTANFTPSSVTVSCVYPGGTNPANQTPSPSPTLSGSFVPVPSATFFEETVPGTAMTISIAAPDPSGAPHNATFTVPWDAKIVWGSVTPPLTAGQALWNTLNTANNVLDKSGGHFGALSFTSTNGQDQVIARLSSYGTPTLKDSGGDSYPPSLVGTVTVTENTVSGVSYSFWTVGAPGITFSWSM